MKDLHLWRLLQDEPLDAAAVVPLLVELSQLTLRQRFPFFSRLPLSHASAEVRAAAVHALAGADGPLAFPALVAALDDGDEAVRAAAVASLRESAVGHPARWTHALFHADARVRRAALSVEPPMKAEAFRFYLLADPESADLLEPDALPVPRGALPALLDFAQRGVLSAHQARRRFAEMPWEATAHWLGGAHRRSREEAQRILAGQGAEQPHAREVLDELFDLFWAEDCEPEARKTLFNKLGSALQGAGAELRVRTVAALTLAARRHRYWLPEAAGLTATYHPLFFTWTWVPGDMRREAIGALYDAPHVPRHPDSLLKTLLEMDLVRRTPERLDLWVVGGMLHYVGRNPYATLLSFVDPELVVRSFVADMERSAPFLIHRDDSKNGRKWIMGRIAAHAPDRRGELLALLAHVARVDELDFLEALEGQDVLSALTAILRLRAGDALALARNKAERISHIFAEKLAPARQPALPFTAAPERPIAQFFEAWLALPAAEGNVVGLGVLGALSRALDTEVFVAEVTALATPVLKKLLDCLPYAPAVTYGCEIALALALRGHVSSVVHRWAAERVREETGPPAPRSRSPEETVDLSDAERDTIAAAGPADLEGALSPCLGVPHRGLCAALDARTTAPIPSVPACVALLACHDDPAAVARWCERFSEPTADFLGRLDAAVVATLQGCRDLPLLGDAWLYRFEAHAFALALALADAPGGLAVTLAAARSIPSPLLVEQVWMGTARALSIWRWRDRKLLAELATVPLTTLLVEQMDTALGEAAAVAFMAIHESRVDPSLTERHRRAVSDKLPDLSDETRRRLGPFVQAGGLPSRVTGARRPGASLDDALLQRIRTSHDLTALVAWCRDAHDRIVHEAALRLIELGEPGREALAALLAEDPPPAEFRAVADSVTLWPEGPAVAGLRALLTEGRGGPELRLLLALALLERGEPRWLEVAVEALCRDADPGWCRREDWDRLRAVAPDEGDLCRTVAGSPHPHVYRAAVEHLLALEAPADGDHAALRAFLDRGTERMGELRRRAAWSLRRMGDLHGFPIAMADAFQGEGMAHLFPGANPALIAATVDAALMGGRRACDEARLLPMLDAPGVDRAARDAAWERLLMECAGDPLRRTVVSLIERRPSRARKLAKVAEIFAWGVRAGRELTGRIFRVHMIGGQGLGYTRLNENRLFVTPLPVLRGERSGREVVEGLVLHEIGHHVYHRGEDEAAVWKEAQEAGIGGLLNLVADEHLERNLRAMDAAYGDRLKKLAAYAFQHSAREIPVWTLFDMLQGRTFEVLARCHLGVARDDACVRVDNGALLSEMERAGLRFAKFIRALRMGLGRRHGEPVVDEALGLFGRPFRKGDMRSLLDISYRLRDLFGWEVQIVETFGGHESIGDDARDRAIHGEGIDDREVQQEVERVLSPPRASGGRPSARKGRLVINVGPDESFDRIMEVQKVDTDPMAHREVARTVARHAHHMRRYLEELGLRLEPRRFRLRGRRFDTTRAKAVVTRGDPRMLVARETVVITDLFLGVMVDCSGSMAGQSMDLAHAFGVMLAEAARGMGAIDLRLFGFTDAIIWDAGNANRPAVASLAAEGGNNDAAALFHLAEVAKASRRKAKLLVMISDGLPTECSVAALRALVDRLTRREKMCCAQIAVRPLEEICFPHYVEVRDEDMNAAVRRFGRIIAGLVRKAMGS